jgi:branched-chain amino acid transport system substrate-binding protein
MRLRRRKRFPLLVLVSVLALVLAACGSGRDDDDSSSGDGSSDTTAEGDDGGGAFEIDTANCTTDPSTVELTGDTIKIGTSLPQSGTYAAFSSILKGEQAYIDYLNAEKGGVEIAGKTYKIELVAKDDAYDAATTVSNVQSLVDDDGVFALFNVVGTKNNLAIRDFVNDGCVPNLLAATGSPAWGNRDYPWLLGTFLVPYPLEMQAFVDYLETNKPDATIAVLRANDDFGAAYSETLKALIEGTDLTIADEQTYDTETGEVATQVTSLAASNADAFVLGATLLACPTALTDVASSGWKPITYMSGTCTSKTLMTIAGAAGDGVISVAPLLDPNDPANASNAGMTLYKEKIAQYAPADTDAGNGIVAYGWTAAATLEALLSQVEEPNRLGVMQTARTLEVEDVGLQLPDSVWSVSADDWFLGENFDLVQYSLADGYFKPVGERIDAPDETEELTPENLING